MAKQYLTPPANYSPPDDARPGEKFSATVELQPEEDGRLCILSIDGTLIEEADDEAAETKTDDEGAEGEMPMKGKMGTNAQTLQEAVKAHRAAGSMM